jgi:asparagine synthetase B (glutamine-hydrolysing)
VEELEQTQLSTARRIEGLQLRLQTANREFREVETEHIRLAGEIAQEEMRKRLERIDAETLRQAHNILAHWRAACRASYELCEHVGTNVEANPEMTERQKTDRIVKARELLRGPNLSIESWEQNRRPALRMNLPIRSMRAAESLRHLEELQ